MTAFGQPCIVGKNMWSNLSYDIQQTLWHIKQRLDVTFILSLFFDRESSCSILLHINLIKMKIIFIYY